MSQHVDLLTGFLISWESVGTVTRIELGEIASDQLREAVEAGCGALKAIDRLTREWEEKAQYLTDTALDMRPSNSQSNLFAAAHALRERAKELRESTKP